MCLQATEQSAASDHAEHHITSAPVVWLADSRANKVVPSLRVAVAENFEPLRSKPIRIDLALYNMRLATPAHHEAHFPA